MTIGTQETRKLRKITKRQNASRRTTRVLFPTREKTKAQIVGANENEPTCGKWSCRKCSCMKYEGTESGGYKCKKCDHYYEDHRTS